MRFKMKEASSNGVIVGSVKAERTADSFKKVDEFSKVTKENETWRMFIPIMYSANGQAEALMVSKFGHSIDKDLGKKLGRYWIPSETPRDPETFHVKEGAQIDTAARLAIFSKVAFDMEEGKALQELDSKEGITEVEKALARKKIIEAYEGEDKGKGYNEGQTKFPLLGTAKMKNFLMAIVMKFDEVGEPMMDTAKIVSYHPSNAKVKKINEILSKTMKAVSLMKSRAEDPDSIEYPDFLEIQFAYGKDDKESSKRGKVDPSRVDLKSSLFETADYKEDPSVFEALVRQLPEDPDALAMRESSFQPANMNKIVAELRVSILIGFNKDYLASQQSIEYFDKNAEVLNEFLPDSMKIAIDETKKSETPKSLLETLNAEAEANKNSDEDTDDGSEILDNSVSTDDLADVI